MSFGFGIGDFILLTDLAWTTVENARKACGALDSLTCEVNSLHIVLQRLQTEVSKPESILNRKGDNRRKDLRTLAKGCKRVLGTLSGVLEKYNRLSEEQRSVTKLWQKVKFGNGEMQDLGIIRTELATYTQSITLFLNLLSIGELGRVGRYMDNHGEDLRDIKTNLHWVVASMQANSHEEKSILTTYTEDDKAVWKEFRRELIKLGVSSRVLRKHEDAIRKYVFALGKKGALDAPVVGPEQLDETHATDGVLQDLVYSWTQANGEVVDDQSSEFAGPNEEDLDTTHSDEGYGDGESRAAQHDALKSDVESVNGFPDVATYSSARASEVDGHGTESNAKNSGHNVDFAHADNEKVILDDQHGTDSSHRTADPDEVVIQVKDPKGGAKSNQRPSTSTVGRSRDPRHGGSGNKHKSTKTRKGLHSSKTELSRLKNRHSHKKLEKDATLESTQQLPAVSPAHHTAVGHDYLEVRDQHSSPKPFD